MAVESERMHCDQSGHVQLSLGRLSLVTLKSVLLRKEQDNKEKIRKKLNIYFLHQPGGKVHVH